jgi:hypothetical protein
VTASNSTILVNEDVCMTGEVLVGEIVLGEQEDTVALDRFQVPALEAAPSTGTPGLLRRAARALARFVRALVRGTGSFVSAVATPFVLAVNYHRAYVRASNYQAQHRANRTWFGVQRSTSQRNAERAQASKEGELSSLPDEYVGWLIFAIEAIRNEDRVLHPRSEPGRHFVCS